MVLLYLVFRHVRALRTMRRASNFPKSARQFVRPLTRQAEGVKR